MHCRTLLCILIAACLAVGCQKAAPSSAPLSSGTNAKESALSADDQLMLAYLQARKEYAELLEKKAPEASDAAARSSAKLDELHALPQDRQMALQRKYQKEWDVANERVRKAISPGKP